MTMGKCGLNQVRTAVQSTPFLYIFPLISGIRFRSRDRVRDMFLARNVVLGSTKDVDPGTCLALQNYSDQLALSI